MRIYLDNCCYGRLFDVKFDAKIRAETEAIASILDNIRDRRYDLVWSFVLDYEIGNNPTVEDRKKIMSNKQRASFFVERNSEEVMAFARTMISQGVKLTDAFHIACAFVAGCEYFLTTDTRFLKAAQNNKIKVMNPVRFIEEMEGSQ